MTNLTLYQVAAEYRQMAEQLADLDLDEQTVADTLEAEGGELMTKGTNIGFVIRNLEATALQIKDAEKAMANRRKAIENRAERIKQYLFDGMTLAQIEVINSPYFNLTIRKNPPAVQIVEESMIPAAFMRQPEPPPAAPDKKAIADALKDGIDVPGAILVQSQRLEIK
jgi:hypothetical protein